MSFLVQKLVSVDSNSQTHPVDILKEGRRVVNALEEHIWHPIRVQPLALKKVCLFTSFQSSHSNIRCLVAKQAFSNI
jgi:hypothetical protein